MVTVCYNSLQLHFLIKSKSADFTDVNNYRAIAGSTAASKLFECIVAEEYHSTSPENMYQFGFKSNHSTGLCTSILKRTVNYYTERGSNAFLCFIDLYKAFDMVNYWTLFNMLLDDDISPAMVHLLAYWYSNQEMCVRWNSVLSTCFTIGNGTRQCGVLSPYLFSSYISGLIRNIANCTVGCNIGNMSVNILAYADDIVLLSPSWQGLQLLIDTLFLCVKDVNMLCNGSKTVCMVVNPRRRSALVRAVFPSFKLGTIDLQFVPTFCYLGHIFTESLCDNENIHIEIKNLFGPQIQQMLIYGQMYIVPILLFIFVYCTVAEIYGDVY